MVKLLTSFFLCPLCLHAFVSSVVNLQRSAFFPRSPRSFRVSQIVEISMRKVRLAALAALAACADGETAASGDTIGSTGIGATAIGTAGIGATSGASSSGTARAQPSREIYIDSVKVGNPLVVRGRARTFENTVQVRVRDARGAEIVEVFTTSVGEMGNHNPFTAEAWLTRPPGDRVIVESFEYSAKDGSVRSLTADTLVFAVPNSSHTIDFPAGDCTKTVSVRREAPRTVAVARLLAEILVAGPDSAERAAGASSVFPRGSRVQSVILRQGELTVDFNERLQNVGGSCAAQAIRTAVTTTVSRLPAVRRVIITAGGSRDLALQP